MAVGYLIVALVSAAVAIFALQNTAPASVRFLFWSADGLPVGAVILVSLAAGIVVAGLPLLVRSVRWRSRARTLEARVQMLERAVAERDQAVLKKTAAPAP
jgi:uncharacterized integral membrane protein